MRLVTSLMIVFVSLPCFATSTWMDNVPENRSVDSICDSEDTRKPSTEPYVARFIRDTSKASGCTAFLISNTCMVTAGHCYGQRIVEFNTPLSKGGKGVNAKPEDQYEMVPDSMVYENGSKGVDWGVFKVKANAITKKTPGEVQGGFYNVTFEVPAQDIEVQLTGHGRAVGPTVTFAQQTSYGPLTSVGTKTSAYLGHRADTTGGSSGSPILDKLTQEVLGVHAHAGCSSSATSYNNGTSVALNAKFKKAVEDCLAPNSSN